MKITHGLKPHKKDSRDYQLGSLFPIKITVPLQDFLIADPAILDQGNTQACTCFAGVVASSIQEKIELAPEYNFAKAHQIAGDDTDGALELRTACQSFTDYGSLEKNHCPYTFAANGSPFVANWANWDSIYDVNARFYRKKAYISVDNTFSAIQHALWLYRGDSKPRAVLTGALWRNEWINATGGIIPTQYSAGGSGHAFIFIGQKIIDGKPYLIAHLSNGTNIGDKGRFYFSEEVVNKEMVYGNFMFLDLNDRELAIVKNANTWLGRLKKIIKNYFYEFN